MGRSRKTINYLGQSGRPVARVLAPSTYNPLASSGKVRCPITWDTFYPTEWQGATQRNVESIDATVCTAAVDGYGAL